MLKVYGASWCPHCRRAVRFLEENDIPHDYIEIEEQPDEVVKKVIEVNGGEDWVVPTLEFKGTWREGKVFDAEGLRADLERMGVIGRAS